MQEAEELPIEPKNWGFFYHREWVQEGFAEWESTGKMPRLEDLLGVDPLWRKDLRMMKLIVTRQRSFKKAQEKERQQAAQATQAGKNGRKPKGRR